MSEKYLYSHVVIVGLDGMGNFNKNTETPNMDRIFGNGAQSFDSLSLYPTISAQNWGAMLLGTDPDVHGLTNSIVGRELYTNKAIPSVFSTLRREMPDSVLCSISNWAPINYGIIEHDIDVYMEDTPDGTVTTDRVVECVLTRKPTLLFIQIDDPDGAGHHFGYGTEGHLECIRNTDQLVGRIHKAYEDAGILEDTLFIAIADHGGFIRGHGGYSDGEKYIYFALAGKTVNSGASFFAQTKDINAIVRHAFGLPIPAYDPAGYSSQIPAGLFADCDTEYRYFVPERFEMPNRPTPALTDENGLFSFFKEDELKLAMFFDNDYRDALGKEVLTENGHVKYYSTGVRGAMGELGAIGYLVDENMRFGTDDFTVCQWIKVDDAPSADCFICGTKTMQKSGAGFAIGFTCAGTSLGIETSDPSTYIETITPFYKEISGGWLHAIYSFDRKNFTVDVYHNFTHKTTVKLPDIFTESLDVLPFTVGEDGSQAENREKGVIFNMDDFFIFNKAFDAADVKKLAAYYGL